MESSLRQVCVHGSYANMLGTRLAVLDKWLRSISLPWLILAGLVSSYVIVLPVALFETIIGAPQLDSGPSLYGNWIGTFIIACIVAPLLETLMFQWLPIRAVQYVSRKSRWSAIMLSAIAFSVAHWYNGYYVIFAFLVGLVFAYSFIICDQAGKRPFLSVCLIHALRNW
jgi:membrane protease YdiL (CAAX protease family)